MSGTGLHAEVKVHGARHPVPQAVEDQLFRVGQEALTNAIKHAGCRSLKVELDYRGRGLALTVADDGRGFTPGAARPSTDSGGFGILGMRERMAQIGGTLDVESGPGRGTRIIARWKPGDRPPADGEKLQGNGR